MGMIVTKDKNGLRVSNVQIMGVLGDDVRPDVPSGITLDMMERMVSIFEQNKKRGKMPRFTLGHNKPHEEAPVIGKVVGLRVEHGWLMGDILITNPEAQEMFKRGEIPGLSAEFFPDEKNPALWSVATTLGDEGQFDIEKADFQPNELTDALAAMRIVRGEPVRLAVQELNMLEGIQVEIAGMQELFDRVSVLEESVMNLQSPSEPEDEPEDEGGKGDSDKGSEDEPTRFASNGEDENESQNESQKEQGDGKPSAVADGQDAADEKSEKSEDDEDDKEDKEEKGDAQMSEPNMEVARLRAENDLLKAGVSIDKAALESAATEDALTELVATMKADASAKTDDTPAKTGNEGLSRPAQIKLAIAKVKAEEHVNHFRAAKLVRARQPELFEDKE